MPRQSKGSLLRWGALFLLLPIITAQTPVTKKPYIYWWQTGDAAYTWKPLIIDAPLTVTQDATGNFHLSVPASTPSSLTFTIPGGGDPQPVTKLVIGEEFQTTYTADGTVTVNMDLAKVASRYAFQAGFRSAMSNGNPQTCVEQPLVSTDDNVLVIGQDYAASCSTSLPKLEQYQVLNLVIQTANIGPVSLSIDTLSAMPVLDRRGNPLAAGVLIPGLYRIWNDGANWRVSEL